MTRTFRKSERLSSKKIMDQIFTEGKTIKGFPFVVKYLFVDTLESPAQVAVSVSKRKFKRAVDRNRIKRQMREAYRLNKIQLVSELEAKNKFLAFFLIYSGNEKVPFDIIEGKIKLILKELTQLAS